MTDVLIIGGGPAGVSAALYTTRAGLKTTIIHKDSGALTKAERVDNFYGNPGITGVELIAQGLAQATDVGAEVVAGEVVKISVQPNGNDLHFNVETTEKTYSSKALLLATGANRQTPNISGLADLEGKGVSHCAVCDAFFYRNKDVAVLGHSQYALSEANELLPMVKSLHLLTNGQEPDVAFPPEVIIRKEKIQKILGENKLTGGSLKNEGEDLPLDGIFIALGTAGATALARKLGALTENNTVIVDENMRTNIPGLWAAGDCTPGMKQIAKAVYDGAVAGMDIVRGIRVVSQ
ncbi:MAG: NAD(P)/FAD-dependent oxidoreductase [Defluviitaleaceae bacterium]|nr:NAD(P)/FAD-dependent oxidoreductase [Defluviitaleaceae bacterium]